MMSLEDYQGLFDSCTVTTEPTRALEIRAICKAMFLNQVTYQGVEDATGIPWFVVACIHYRESNLSFKGHLHNGDPLTARTVRVPEGRPADGAPPFTWTASAIDALSNRAHPLQWGVAGALEFCERYNGLGYQKRGMNSPYIWSCTDKYTSGLFVADGTIDLEKKDARPGVAAILKTLQSVGVMLEYQTIASPDSTMH